MCLSHTRVPHEQKSGLVTAWIVTNEGLRKKLGPLQGFSLLRCVSLTVGKVRHVTLKIAMLVALGNPRALHHPLARSCIPQSQGTATLPAAPSGRGTSFHPVPLHSVQLSSAMPTAYEDVHETASCLLWETCGRNSALLKN